MCRESAKNQSEENWLMITSKENEKIKFKLSMSGINFEDKKLE